MKIEDLDKNLKVETTIDEPDLVWLSAGSAPFSLHGVYYDEKEGRYLRMPQDAAKAVSEKTVILSRHTAGGRLRFRTDSPCIAIRAVMKNVKQMSHFTLLGQQGFDLYRKIDGEETYYRSFMPPMGMQEGYSSLIPTGGGILREYTINFPLYDGVLELFIGLKKDAVLEKAAPYRIEKPIVYYGSSITQGGCASRPGNSYQAIISRRLNADHINLGFSGNAFGQEAMARYIAGLEMSVYVSDLDHNLSKPEDLEKVHLPFLRIIREKNPALPIVIVSAPTVLLRGGSFTGKRQVVMDSYETLKKEGDRNVYFVDGKDLFAGPLWDACTVDGTHPNDLGFARMALKIGDALEEILGKA